MKYLKLLPLIAGLAVAFVPPAEAKQRKHPRYVTTYSTYQDGYHRGQNIFMPGPFSVAGYRLSDDPDPFIRSQILRADGNFGGHK